MSAQPSQIPQSNTQQTKTWTAGIASLLIGVALAGCSPSKPIEHKIVKVGHETICAHVIAKDSIPSPYQGLDYAVAIEGGVIALNPDNTYQMAGGFSQWKKLHARYPEAQIKMKADAMWNPAYGQLAVEHDGTLYLFTPQDVLVGFDGLGYMPLHE
jgi:hypothetical protein